MVVLQATTPVPPDSWVRLETDGRIPSLAGLATSGRTQNYTIKVEPTFLVNRFECQSACDPDNHNPILFRVAVKAEAFAAALKVSDVTTPGQRAADDEIEAAARATAGSRINPTT